MAEIASNVLHNVGNVLNSVNVSATVLAERLAASRAFAVAKTAVLLREHEEDLGAFLTEDPRGRLLPTYLERLGETLADEHRAMSSELESLRNDVGHIKQIVRTQQSFARTNADVREFVSPSELLEDALRIAGHTAVNEAIEVVREYDAVPDVRLDRHKVVHVIVNLISNARHAIAAAARGGQIRLCISRSGAAHVRLDVIDNGVGIPAENLVRVFNYGFTTRPEGHGFGLHGAALWAKELGGTLTAHSLGSGRGARFSLLLPVDHDPARPANPRGRA
jgi:two-component system, NtrC family, sensor kinase